MLSVVSREVCRVAGRVRDGGGSCCSQQQLELSQYEWVELESDHEPEPPCTILRARMCFDTPAEARLRGLDQHELMHFVFEHGVSEGLRIAECQRGQVRARDRLDENVFDPPAMARRRGWDEHELTHMVFEFGEEEGMRMMAELSLEDDASSVVFQGAVVQEPRVCLALDELLPVYEVRQVCEAPEPAKSVQILFRGQHGLGVWKLVAEQSLAEWYSGRKLVGELDGYFATVGGKILDSRVRVGSLGPWTHGRGGVSSEALGW